MLRELEELVEALVEAVEDDIEVCMVDDTCMLEAESFELSFVIEVSHFEIRNIKTRRQGLGKTIITTIHEYCDACGLCVHACCVKSSAIGFWHKMGYVEGGNEEFFRVA